jgi:hypothetical protein
VVEGGAHGKGARVSGVVFAGVVFAAVLLGIRFFMFDIGFTDENR